MKKLIACRLTLDSHPALIEHMRVLYNDAIPFFTKPLTPNTPEQQQAWWKGLDHNKVACHLYSPADFPWVIAAFSMVTDRGPYCTPIFAISDQWHGFGFAREIIVHYLSLCQGKPLRGEQLTSNAPIRHLNQEMGWTITEERNGVQFLWHPNGNARQQEIYDEMMRRQSSQ